MDRENNYIVELLNLSEVDTVTHAPTTKTVVLQPPVGFVYEVIDINYNAGDPSGSGSGTHQIYGRYEGAFSDIFRVKGNFGSSISIIVSGLVGNAGETPSAIADQLRLMQHTMIVSNTCFLNFNYTNSTDVDQTGTRSLTVVVKKYREAVD